MDKFTLETGIQFPIFKLTELVTYSEVKKPSGVAYILLVLIQGAKERTTPMGLLLTNINVPVSLHHVFAREARDMMEQGIIDCTYDGFTDDEFETLTLNQFSFTTKGRKVFAEESIPTDKEKEAKIELFYDVAENAFEMQIPTDEEPRPLMDSFLKPDFFAQFSVQKEPEDFINLQKGRGIGIKKEEVIIKVEEQGDKENWVGKQDATVSIAGNSVSLRFEDGVHQKFLEDHYTGKLLSDAFAMKSKFNFPGSYRKGLHYADYAGDSLDSVKLPKELGDILKQKSKLMVTNGDYTSPNLTIQSNAMGPYSFLLVDNSNWIFGYIPGVFDFKSEKFGTISIPLLLKMKATIPQLQEAVKPYLAQISAYSSENFRMLVRLTEIDKDYDSAYSLMEGYLPGDAPSALSILSEMRPYAVSSPKILSRHKEMTEREYHAYLSAIKEDGLETAMKIIGWVPKYLNIGSRAVLDEIFQSISPIKDPVAVFESLSASRYDELMLMNYVNPVPDALKSRRGQSASLVSLLDFDDAISDLKEISGIEGYHHVRIDEDEIPHDQFKATYSQALKQRKNIALFKDDNQTLFETYDGFMGVFGEINDYLNKVDNAMKNPNSVTSDLIEKKIVSGDYNFVFIHLAAKLSSALSGKYHQVGTLAEMLSGAQREGLLPKETLDDLYFFRKARNSRIHLEEQKDVEFSAEDLRRWGKEIFELSSEKKEEGK